MSISRGANPHQLPLFENAPTVHVVKYGDRTRVAHSTFVCGICARTFPVVSSRKKVCAECYKLVPCVVDGCDKPRKDTNKYCGPHRWRMSRYGTTDELATERAACAAPSCDLPAKCIGLCERHRDRKRFGTPNWDRPLDQCATDGCEGKTPPKNRYCDPCKKVRNRMYGKNYYDRNPEKEKVRRKAYYDANPEKVKESSRKWLAKNPGYSAESARRWREANYMRARTIEGRKYAKRRLQIKLTQVEPIDYGQIVAEHGMVCHICGGEIVSRSDLNIDHVVPLSRGGTHTKDNLKPSHAACNIRKSDKLMSEL